MKPDRLLLAGHPELNERWANELRAFPELSYETQKGSVEKILQSGGR